MISDVLLEVKSPQLAERLRVPIGTKIRPDAMDSTGYFVKVGYVEEHVPFTEAVIHRTSGILKG